MNDPCDFCRESGEIVMLAGNTARARLCRKHFGAFSKWLNDLCPQWPAYQLADLLVKGALAGLEGGQGTIEALMLAGKAEIAAHQALRVAVNGWLEKQEQAAKAAGKPGEQP